MKILCEQPQFAAVSGNQRVHTRSRSPSPLTSRRFHNIRCSICCPVRPDNHTRHARISWNWYQPLAATSFNISCRVGSLCWGVPGSMLGAAEGIVKQVTRRSNGDLSRSLRTRRKVIDDPATDFYRLTVQFRGRKPGLPGACLGRCSQSLWTFGSLGPDNIALLADDYVN